MVSALSLLAHQPSSRDYYISFFEYVKRKIEKNQKIEKNEVVEEKFTKSELLTAKILKNRKDILNVLIKDDEKLSIREAQERIEKFMKGKVK